MMNHDNQYMHVSIDVVAKKQLKENWGWFLALGIGLVVLGSLSLMFSLVSTIISVEYIGFFLLLAGFFEGVKALKMSRWSGFFLHLFLAVFFIVGGVLFVSNPQENAISLTLFLAFFFIVSGILRMVFSYAQHVPHAGWLMLNGIMSVFLGVLIWQQWPSSGLWVLGTLLGVDMLFTGWTWIMLGLRAKNLSIENGHNS